MTCKFLFPGDYTIPEGCNIFFPIIHIHRNKRHWGDDADEFKPQRFEPESIKKVHPYAYMPFAKGSRNCIGYKYAESTLKVVMAHFYRRFKVSTLLKLNEVEFGYTIVTKVMQGYFVSLEKRNFHTKQETCDEPSRANISSRNL